jgi:hypothetical protein
VNARVATLALKGLYRVNANRTGTISTLDSNHKVVVFMSNGQHNIVLAEFSRDRVPNLFGGFNLYWLTCSARRFDGSYKSLEIFACVWHVSFKATWSLISLVAG